MENYYHLTKKELSYITTEQAPVIGYNGKRLTQPVVVCVFKHDKSIFRVWTLKWFKSRVKDNTIYRDLYEYHIRAMF